MAIRVASGIWALVLIQTSVVMECVANSSLPSRPHPLCRLFLEEGWDGYGCIQLVFGGVENSF